MQDKFSIEKMEDYLFLFLTNICCDNFRSAEAQLQDFYDKERFCTNDLAQAKYSLFLILLEQLNEISPNCKFGVLERVERMRRVLFPEENMSSMENDDHIFEVLTRYFFKDIPFLK